MKFIKLVPKRLIRFQSEEQEEEEKERKTATSTSINKKIICTCLICLWVSKFELRGLSYQGVGSVTKILNQFLPYDFLFKVKKSLNVHTLLLLLEPITIAKTSWQREWVEREEERNKKSQRERRQLTQLYCGQLFFHIIKMLFKFILLQAFQPRKHEREERQALHHHPTSNWNISS